MDLIIVESPTKARTLTKYLKGEYRVEATIGHIRDLPKADLGVDVEHNYQPTYIVPKVKQKRVGELKEIAKKADSIILATDPDREGEAIAWHVAEIIQNSKFKIQNLQRIVFHEITEHAIKEALAHPRTIDLQLVDAQQARRVLDRLVGYKLSPLLWQKLSRKWLSAGRVQSVAVRLIVEREREIEKFAKVEFWTIEGVFGLRPEVGQTFSVHPSNPNTISPTASSAKDMTVLEKASLPGRDIIRAQLVSKNDVKYEKSLTYKLFDGKYTTTSSAISDQSSAVGIVADFKAPFTVSAVDKKDVKRYPYPPYTTSTLQQDAGRKFYFSAKRTMQLAQELYEEGFITYHRTDSVNFSEKFISEVREHIRKTYGSQYLPDKARRYQTKSKVAQEAHEAIRPTDVTVYSLQFTVSSQALNKDHARLYELIWKRAVASQAREALFDATTIVITSSNRYRFEASGSIVKFDGFLKITGRDSEDVFVPNVRVGENVALWQALPSQHVTNPPPRYTEASLIKTLEEKGIGRPSTYAPILSTIIERTYIVKEDLPAGRQGKRLKPTELGDLVTDFLIKYFPTIMDLPFTATMEDSLDEIANGVQQWVPVIDAFYKPFAKHLEYAFDNAEKVVLPVEKTELKCPDCAHPLVIRTGRYGKFLACSTFPKCSYTKQVSEKIDKKCPRCGGDIIIKKSRRGKTFYGCSNYPTCHFAAWKKEDIK